MSSAAQAARITVLAPVWHVPVTLADFECEHGRLGDCADCRDDELAADQGEQLELEVVG